MTAESIAGTMAAYQLTEIANTNPTETPAKAKTPTKTFSVPTLTTVMPGVTPSPTSEVCLAAKLVSETNTDGTIRMPGEAFTQTWTFRNIGNCAWTENYSLVWISDGRGVKMSTIERMPFPGYVAPGQSISFSVPFTAPQSQGTWSSFFQFESPNGTRFGATPQTTFWVSVVVPAPTGLPVTRTLKGDVWSVRSDGKSEANLYVGDNDLNLYQEAYGLYNTEAIPSNAVLSNIGLDIDGTYRGNPFGNLGCLNVINAGSGQIMWTLCDFSEISNTDIIWGDSTSIAAGQAGIYARTLQIRLAFESQTNNDNAPDRLLVSRLQLTFYYNNP